MPHQRARGMSEAIGMGTELNAKLQEIMDIGKMLQRIQNAAINSGYLGESMPTAFITQVTYNRLLEHAKCFGACNIRGGTEMLDEMEVYGIRICALGDREVVLTHSARRITEVRHGDQDED